MIGVVGDGKVSKTRYKVGLEEGYSFSGCQGKHCNLLPQVHIPYKVYGHT